MLRNFLVTAWRSLTKNKVYSVINVFGLATGMAISLLIGLWIWDEVSYDTYHDRHRVLAQVMSTQVLNGQKETTPAISIPEGQELANRWGSAFAGVTLASWNESHIFSVGDKRISQSGMWAQPKFPDMLTLKMVSGDRDALRDPSAILLNASMAKALFGPTDPLGKTVKIDNHIDLRVSGVFEDLPANTTLNEAHAFMAWDKYVSTQRWIKNIAANWNAHSFQLFVQLNPGGDMGATNRSIRDVVKAHSGQQDEELLLAPMDRWHLYNEYKDGREAGGRIQFVWLFGIIGAFVLLLACINFMNLSTARSEKRAKEVGIRKTLGSRRFQLVGQLLSESLLVALLALGIAIVLVYCCLPLFNGLSAKAMSLPLSDGRFWEGALAFTLFTGLLAGSYPALYLSAFRPVRVLKGPFKAGRYASIPRKVLVVLQFTVSVALIAGTLIVFRQIQYAKSRPVGYSRQGLIAIDMNTPEIFGHYNALRSDLLQTGVVENMSESSSLPTEISSAQTGFNWPGMDPNSTAVIGTIAVTHDYGQTMGWQVVQGRDFSRDFPADTGGFILNESAVKLMGLRNPVGQMIQWGPGPHRVLGVVRDMVMESPYTPAMPTVFLLNYGWTQAILLRLKPNVPVQEALDKIAPVFQRYDPGSPFQYKFTDDEYALKFADEERVGNLASVFALLAIFISCLGLFGLVSFVAEQRTKEIGVRKVLGASVFYVWKLLSTDFIVLVLLSCAIATPVAWYYLHRWLEHYAYHVGMSWWIFALAALGALTITLATVSVQSVRAALANPVKSLRSE